MRSFFPARPEAVNTAEYRIVFTLLGLLAGLALAGCASPAQPLAGADPADPNVRVDPVGYRSTTAPYQRLRPVEPSLQRPAGR